MDHSPVRRGSTEFSRDLLLWRQFTQASCYQHIAELVEVLLAENSNFTMRLENAWRTRQFVTFYDRPLLFMASLRWAALREGRGHPLWERVGDGQPDGPVTRQRLLEATSDAQVEFWNALTTRIVQTNESSRAVVWLWPAYLLDLSHSHRPVVLVDLGCSAGLNLIAERLPTCWTSISGASLPVAKGLNVIQRIGLDAKPIDVFDHDAVLWLRSCIWANDKERLIRFEQGIEEMRVLLMAEKVSRPVLEAVDAKAMPAHLMQLRRSLPEGAFVLAFQTLLRDYLDPDVCAAYSSDMESWLGSEPVGNAIWLELENRFSSTSEFPAEIIAHTRQFEGVSVRLAGCSYHPRTIESDELGVRRLQAAFSGQPL